MVCHVLCRQRQGHRVTGSQGVVGPCATLAVESWSEGCSDVPLLSEEWHCETRGQRNTITSNCQHTIVIDNIKAYTLGSIEYHRDHSNIYTWSMHTGNFTLSGN